MRIADRIREVLVQNNFEDVFMVTGGMAMHLNDALTRNNKIKPTFFHHEQACAMAADAYSRSTGKISAICVTAGPGSWKDKIYYFLPNMPPSANGNELQTEYFVPIDKAVDAWNDIFAISDKFKHLVRNCLCRVIAGDEMPMS